MGLLTIYRIDSFHAKENEISAYISFNTEHEVFKAHFPGSPIVPGVVQIQIIKDLLKKHFSKDLILKKSRIIKYLNVISPVTDKNLHLNITIEDRTDLSIPVKCVITSDV